MEKDQSRMAAWHWLTRTWLGDVLGILGIVAIGLHSKRPIDRWRRFRWQTVMIAAMFAVIVAAQLCASDTASWTVITASATLAIVFIGFAKMASGHIATLEGQR